MMMGLIINPMEVSLDQYVRNLRMFYNQMIKGHKKEEELVPKFKAMLEVESKKWRKNIAMRKDNRTGQTANLLAKLKDKKTGKDKSKVNVDVLYASTNLPNIVVFGYCYLLMEHKNHTALQFLTQSMKAPLSNRDLFTEPMFRKIRNLWDKMEQTVSGKRRIIRFEKQLQECFKDMPQFIMDILYGIILNQAKIGTEHIEGYLKEVSHRLGVRIQYFTISQKESIQYSTIGGDGEKQGEERQVMRFGMFGKDGIFGYVGSLPEKQEVQVNKEATWVSFAETSENLMAMYSANNNEYMELSHVSSGPSKAGKLKRSGSVISVASVASAQALPNKFKSSVVRANSEMDFGSI